MTIHTWDGTQWVVPSNVSRWSGSSWNQVKTVRRWDGSNWVVHWPVEQPLQTDNASSGSTGWVYSQSGYDGHYESYKTVQIPSTYLNSVSYVTRVDLRKGARHPHDDDEFGSVAHRIGVRVHYVYNANPPTYQNAYIGNIVEHGPFDSVRHANDTFHGFTFTAPTDRVIIGVRFRAYGDGDGGDNLGTAYAGHTFHIRTGQVINPDDYITLEGTNQTSSTDTDSINRDSGGWYFQYATASTPTAIGSQYLSGLGIQTADSTSGAINDDNWGGDRDYRARITGYFREGSIKTK